MTRPFFALKSIFIMLVGVSAYITLANAQENTAEIYRDAKIDDHIMKVRGMTGIIDSTEAAQKELLPLTQTIAYSTNDAYGKVLRFFKSKGTQVKPPLSADKIKLSNGKLFRESCVILDSAKTLSETMEWVLIQNHFLGNATGMKENAAVYDEIVKKTVIIHHKRIGGLPANKCCGG